MKKKLSTIILLTVLLAGVALILYPTVSDYWNSFHQSRALANYTQSVTEMSGEEYEHLWSDAEAYNQSLIGRTEPFVLSDAELEEYNALLNVTGNGIMGYIEIPKIHVSLPLYHSVEKTVLQVAVGHIPGSSLPVGGESTHCVLSGHRGLPSAKLFTDLDQLEVGDTFVLRVLNETLTYEVDQVHIVQPYELDDLAIEEGQDYCTLVTCTPYGINTHRLLVRGHRIESPEAVSVVHVPTDAMRIDPIMVAPFAAIPLLLFLFALLLVSTGKKKKL